MSIPKSAKKLDDFGGATWLSTCGPPELNSEGWSLSTYSKRDAKDELTDEVLLVEEETGTEGSSGFCSYKLSLGCINQNVLLKKGISTEMNLKIENFSPR